METNETRAAGRRGPVPLLAGASLAALAVLAGGCGLGSASPPAKAPAASPAPKHHRHAIHAHRGGVLRISAVSSTQVSLSHGRHHAAVSSSLPVYFEGVRVSAAWLHVGERVHWVGAASAPTALELRASVAGTVQQVSPTLITVRTAKGKAVSLALPTPVAAANLTWPPAVGTKVAILAEPRGSGQDPVAAGIAGQPTVAHGQFVSRSGSQIVVAVNGHDSPALPFLGAPGRLAKLKPGQALTVWESAAGQPLAVP